MDSLGSEIWKVIKVFIEIMLSFLLVDLLIFAISVTSMLKIEKTSAPSDIVDKINVEDVVNDASQGFFDEVPHDLEKYVDVDIFRKCLKNYLSDFVSSKDENIKDASSSMELYEVLMEGFSKYEDKTGNKIIELSSEDSYATFDENMHAILSKFKENDVYKSLFSLPEVSGILKFIIILWLVILGIFLVFFIIERNFLLTLKKVSLPIIISSLIGIVLYGSMICMLKTEVGLYFILKDMFYLAFMLFGIFLFLGIVFRILGKSYVEQSK